LRSRPSVAGTANVSNGGVMNTTIRRKKVAIPISTAVTYGISSRLRWRFCSSTMAVIEVRITSQNSSEPFCPPHSAATV
jgi:hypothetical protein